MKDKQTWLVAMLDQHVAHGFMMKLGVTKSGSSTAKRICYMLVYHYNFVSHVVSLTEMAAATSSSPNITNEGVCVIKADLSLGTSSFCTRTSALVSFVSRISVSMAVPNTPNICFKAVSMNVCHVTVSVSMSEIFDACDGSGLLVVC